MRNLPAGTITLLFSDIEGSTHLLQQLSDDYADMLTKCRHLLRTAFQMYLGQEVDSQGDAFFFVFTRAADAVSAAAHAQRTASATFRSSARNTPRAPMNASPAPVGSTASTGS